MIIGEVAVLLESFEAACRSSEEVTVSRVDSARSIPAAVVRVLVEHGVSSVVVPIDLEREWVDELSRHFDVRVDHGASRSALARADASVTRAALAIADHGMLVLDGGRGQGRSLLAVLPGLHVAVLDDRDVVASVTGVFDRIAPVGSMIWVGGSAHAKLSPPSRRAERASQRRHVVLLHNEAGR